jgi:hypothetical protein
VRGKGVKLFSKTAAGGMVWLEGAALFYPCHFHRELDRYGILIINDRVGQSRTYMLCRDTVLSARKPPVCGQDSE